MDVAGIPEAVKQQQITARLLGAVWKNPPLLERGRKLGWGGDGDRFKILDWPSEHLTYHEFEKCFFRE